MAKLTSAQSLYLNEELDLIKTRIGGLKKQMRHTEVDHTEEVKDLQSWQRKIRLFLSQGFISYE